MAVTNPLGIDLDKYKWGFREPEKYVYKARKGLDRRVVEEISALKGEPDWMRAFRLHAYEHFIRRPMPTWGADLSQINFDEIYYYIKPTDKQVHSWEELPEEIKRTYDRLGIPEAERKFLAGVGAQYESEVVYHNLKEEWERLGVIFVDTDTAVRQYPDLVREYFGTVVPPEDNKFAALNSAVWSGGSFIYVPEGVRVDIPLQAYFRINAQNVGQFERTLIIVESGAYVHYVEGCLPAGEQVSTGDRWVNVESVQPGDQVATETGHKAKVRAVMVRPYRGDLVEIRSVSRYNTFRLTPEHPVLAVRREEVLVRRRPRNGWRPEVDTSRLVRARPEYTPAGELREGDFLVFPKVRPQGTDPRFTPEQLKLLGYYLAEGSAYVHKALNQPVVAFSLGEHEVQAVEEVQRLIQQVTGKKPQVVRVPGKHAVTVSVYSRELMEFCLEHAGKGAAEKRLSEAIMALPPEQVAPLLEGYFAGDGNRSPRPSGELRRIATASETLARQVQELLARQGIYASIQVRKGGPDHIQGRRICRRDQFVLTWTPGRRMGEVRDAGDYFLVPIKAIRRVPYEGFVFNLDVEGPNSYLVRGFAVHNCTAPIYTTDSLHSAVVEIIVKEGARCRYTTIQNWSTNVYNLVTKRAVAYRDATMEWIDGNLGCLTGDTRVLLNNDVKPISEVAPGDVVYAVDGDLTLTRHKVVATRYSGRQKVYRLRTDNHREIRATANHPFLTLSKRGRHLFLAWKRLDELTTDDLVAIAGSVPDSGTARVFDPVPARGTKQLIPPRVSSDDLMWLLGVYVGDGYVDRARVYFAVPPRDPAHPKLLQLLSAVFGIDDPDVQGGVVRVNSVQLRDFILAAGFAGTAREKRVPRWVYTLPRSQRLAFIEGYVAADGYRRANHTNLSITSVNRALLEDVKALAVSCGLDPRKISRWSRVDKKPLGTVAKEYTPYFLYFGERAFERPVHFARVATIEPEGVEDTWDLEIADAHNFVANGFIVHNSKITMKYPSVYMVEPGAKAEILSVAFAGRGQHQDPGGKVIHAAPYTQSVVVSKSIAKDGGRAGYRGLVKIYPGAKGSRSAVRCDALILDDRSRSDTYPTMEIDEVDVSITHEATVSKVSDEQLFYLMSRGIREDEAMNMIVRGFVEPIVKELPLEYAVELNRLIALEMEGSVG